MRNEPGTVIARRDRATRALLRVRSRYWKGVQEWGQLPEAFLIELV